MKKTVALLIFVFSIFTAKAEINAGYSLEWLCADAGLIAVGKLKSYEKTNSNLMMFLCTFETTEMITGSAQSPVYFIVKYMPEDSLKKYVSEKTPMLVFLKETTRPYKTKTMHTSWQTMETYNSHPAMMNLDTPPKWLIKAEGFMPMTKREDILSFCRSCLIKLGEYQILGKTVFENFLEVPYQTEAYLLLFSGSTCYLKVPDFMFPKSTEKIK